MSEPKPAKSSRRFGCLLRLLVLALLVAVIVFAALDYFFNLRSNLVSLAFRRSRQPMEIRLSGGQWKPLASVTHQELDRALERQGEGEGVTWRSLRVRRHAETPAQRVVGSLFDSTLNVLEFAPGRFDFATSFREHFAVTTALERLETDRLDFAITANFRDPKGRPLGLVVHEGQQRNAPFHTWTGYFFVKDGRPWFGPRSLFEETPGALTEASQGYPSLMRNHTVFSYVDLAPDKYFDGEKISYRALAGTRQNGTIVFILSGGGGAANVAEIATLALKMNVQHATLLDGGRALQYVLRLPGGDLHFAAFNTRLDLPWHRLEKQQSPVFIGARRH